MKRFTFQFQSLLKNKTGISHMMTKKSKNVAVTLTFYVERGTIVPDVQPTCR